jgi:hypothetical protein
MNTDKHFVFIGVYRRSSAANCFLLTFHDAMPELAELAGALVSLD